jgi:NAD-dependent deacetylase
MVDQAYDVSGNADLFISIGTSGEVWSASGIPQIARENNARMIEINPEETEASQLYDDKIRKPSSIALTELFDEY